MEDLPAHLQFDVLLHLNDRLDPYVLSCFNYDRFKNENVMLVGLISQKQLILEHDQPAYWHVWYVTTEVARLAMHRIFYDTAFFEAMKYDLPFDKARHYLRTNIDYASIPQTCILNIQRIQLSLFDMHDVRLALQADHERMLKLKNEHDQVEQAIRMAIQPLQQMQISIQKGLNHLLNKYHCDSIEAWQNKYQIS